MEQEQGGSRGAGAFIEPLNAPGEGISDVELLALLLDAAEDTVLEGPLERAGRLLDRCGSLRGIASKTTSELSSEGGLASRDALRILAALALTRRFAGETIERGRPFRSARDVFEHFRLRFLDRRRERFVVVLLDGKHRVLREETVSVGSLSASLVHPREVFRPAVRHSAAAVVLVHNHPSGDCDPSGEDLEVTRRLARAGELLGIPVLDHVVIGERDFTSLRTEVRDSLG